MLETSDITNSLRRSDETEKKFRAPSPHKGYRIFRNGKTEFFNTFYSVYVFRFFLCRSIRLALRRFGSKEEKRAQ